MAWNCYCWCSQYQHSKSLPEPQTGPNLLVLMACSKYTLLHILIQPLSVTGSLNVYCTATLAAMNTVMGSRWIRTNKTGSRWRITLIYWCWVSIIQSNTERIRNSIQSGLAEICVVNVASMFEPQLALLMWLNNRWQYSIVFPAR
jgi:hypothetical protein